MAFIGNTNTTQAFTPAIDYFSGNASTTAFTLSRPVASVAQVQAVVNNVAQNPSDAFTVSGNTITFTSAPSSGTNNIYVYYTSPITQVIAPSQGTVGTTQLQNGLTVNFADGTAAAPSITNDGDTNTGIFFPAADTIGFAEGGAEVARFDSAGNLGIGTSSPSSVLNVKSSAPVFRLETTGDVTSSGTASYAIKDSSGNDVFTNGFLGLANCYQFTTTFANGFMRFLTGSQVEAMRIDSSGNLLVGQTSGNADARVSIDAGSTDSSPVIDFRKGSATTTTAQVYARFWCSGGSVATGSITANGVSAATFTGYSDRRLKENIVDLPSQLSNIMALRPVEFDFKGYENGEGHQIGFIAQEVQEIYPDSVGEGADGMLTLSDMNKNDARLIKCIQEMKAIIDSQAATITALTARITALENK
jgi:trimeric autotransporter adhesin